MSQSAIPRAVSAAYLSTHEQMLKNGTPAETLFINKVLADVINGDKITPLQEQQKKMY